MTVETRAPKKGQGVPKETPAQNSIAGLQDSLEERFPGVPWDGLEDELVGCGFFEAAMQQQVRILAETSADMLGDQYETADLVSALAASPVEKIRGVAAFTVPLAYPDDLEAQLQELRMTGALEGTWPRELSATVLHNLVIQHGVGTVLPLVQDWIQDPEPAVRRLVVESFRPRGVMLAHIVELKEDPRPLRTFLEPLLDDASDYVRKAVANNLNDVSRDNPRVVRGWAREWLTPEASKERQWILARALRTLVNEGDPGALGILGYTPASDLKVVWKESTPEGAEINQLLPFDLVISNPTNVEALVILLLLMDEPGKGKGRRQSRYQLWKGRIPGGGARSVSKRIHFVDKSTQRKEPGTYRLIVSVNGQTIEERKMRFRRSATEQEHR